MARVACVYSLENHQSSEKPLRSWLTIPFGLASVATALERAGHEVQCWVICPRTSLHQIADEIVSLFCADMIALTAVSTQFPIVNRLGEAIKRRSPQLPVVLGGHHATLAPDNAIASPWIDAICVGEGEAAACAYADNIDRGHQQAAIPGMWIKVPGRRELDRTAPVPFIADLDGLPFIKRNHWARWVDDRDRVHGILIGRGCPYVCTYCSNHALKNITNGKYVRLRSPDSILDELRQLIVFAPDIESVYLEMETIGVVYKNAIELCDKLAEFNRSRHCPIVFGTNLSVTGRLVGNEEQLHGLLSAFQRANITMLNIGLEFGLGTDTFRGAAQAKLFQPRYR